MQTKMIAVLAMMIVMEALYPNLASALHFSIKASQELGSGSNEPHLHVHSDLNADGAVDLVATDSQSNELIILLGNGDGTFQSPARYSTGANPTSAAVANSGQDYISVLLSSGNGTFGSVQAAWVGGKQNDIASADLDRDGDYDLVATVQENGVSKAAVLKSDGDADPFPEYVTD